MTIKKHETLDSFKEALERDEPVAIYDGCLCDAFKNCEEQDPDTEKYLKINAPIKKSKTQVIGANGCFEHEWQLSKLGKIFVPNSCTSMEEMIDYHVQKELRPLFKETMKEGFGLCNDALDDFLSGGNDGTSLSKLLKAKTLVEDKFLWVLDNLSWYAAPTKRDWLENRDVLSITHQKVEGYVLAIAGAGSVYGAAKADIKLPFHSGELMEMVQVKCAKHGFHLGSKNSFDIVGYVREVRDERGQLMDSEYVPIHDLGNVGSIYTKAKRMGEFGHPQRVNVAYSLHLSKEKTQRAQDLIKAKINEAEQITVKYTQLFQKASEEQEKIR